MALQKVGPSPNPWKPVVIILSTTIGPPGADVGHRAANQDMPIHSGSWKRPETDSSLEP